MPQATMTLATDLIKDAVHPLMRSPKDYDPLLRFIGNARFVLLGEASHGTRDFYRERAQITKRLIREKGFTAVAVEADWPDAWRVNRYVQGQSVDADAAEALSGFQRFPSWMWRNTEVLDFVGWLRAHNESLRPGAQTTGFYGLDLYSLHASIEAMLNYLDKADPAAAARARQRYAGFENFGQDPQACGFAAGLALSRNCESAVVAQLVEMQKRADEYARRDGRMAEDDFFYAQQNARLIKSAELYYRTMFRGHISSWNLRDDHMAGTLEALVDHLGLRNGETKVVVWAHNSHLGDARATQMGVEGERNIGQLVRQRYGPQSVLVGFSTYTGTVTAASNWDGPAEQMQVRPAVPESYEAIFHETGIPSFLLVMARGSHITDVLREPKLERAIGVVYRPEAELASHYFHAQLSDQFDAIVHFDQTGAVAPLEPVGQPAGALPGELAGTFPFD